MKDNDWKIGDLVWAYLRGYRPWPAIIITHPDGETKKTSKYVLFFGSKDHAWITNKNLSPFMKNFTKYSNVQNIKLETAIQAAVRYRDKIAKFHNCNSSNRKELAKIAMLCKFSDMCKEERALEKRKNKNLPKDRQGLIRPRSQKVHKTVTPTGNDIAEDIIPKFHVPTYEKRIKEPSKELENENSSAVALGFIGISDDNHRLLEHLLVFKKNQVKIFFWSDTDDKCPNLLSLGATLLVDPGEVFKRSTFMFCEEMYKNYLQKCIRIQFGIKINIAAITRGFQTSWKDLEGYILLTGMKFTDSEVSEKYVEYHKVQYIQYRRSRKIKYGFVMKCPKDNCMFKKLRNLFNGTELRPNFIQSCFHLGSDLELQRKKNHCLICTLLNERNRRMLRGLPPHISLIDGLRMIE